MGSYYTRGAVALAVGNNYDKLIIIVMPIMAKKKSDTPRDAAHQAHCRVPLIRSAGRSPALPAYPLGCKIRKESCKNLMF